MPRSRRVVPGGLCYHIINRGNGPDPVFKSDEDYQALVQLFTKVSEDLPVRLLAYCLLPNHMHLVLWPRGDGELSLWMQRLMTAQVRDHHKRNESYGHIWQGRFKSFPIQGNQSLLPVLRYVEANPLRLGLVKAAQDWPWGSLAVAEAGLKAPRLYAGPTARGDDWLDLVNRPQPEDELAALRRSVNRGTPWGGEAWVKRTARNLGLDSSLRPRGRPKKRQLVPPRERLRTSAA